MLCDIHRAEQEPGERTLTTPGGLRRGKGASRSLPELVAFRSAKECCTTKAKRLGHLTC